MNIKLEGVTDGSTLRIGGEPGMGASSGVGGATPLGGVGENGVSGAGAATGPDGVTFESVLGKLVGTANAQDHDAAMKSEALAAGRLDDLHGTMIAMKEADISMKLVGTVRNKLLDAFHELWRTSV